MNNPTPAQSLETLLHKFTEIQTITHRAIAHYENSIKLLTNLISCDHPNAQSIAEVFEAESLSIFNRLCVGVDPELAGKISKSLEIPRQHCPFPAPFNPARFPADLDAGPNSLGARWLKGWDSASAGAVQP